MDRKKPERRSFTHQHNAVTVLAVLAVLVAMLGLVVDGRGNFAPIAQAAEDAEVNKAAQESPEPGSRFQDCPKCPQMVVLPAGSYRMGSPLWEGGRRKNEGPVHEVTIAVPFAIGLYEVTVAEFGWFVDETGYSAGNAWRYPGFGQSERHPVVNVSWDDAQAYVAWLSWEIGEEYGLPSASEWEYAARAGTATARYWGKSESGQCRHANGADDKVACRDGFGRTAPVGSFAANDWGLHDMLGNVSEWTEDCWSDSYAGAPSDGSAWEQGHCSVRVARGGSWFNSPSILRAANRSRVTSGFRNFIVGFRVTRTLAR